MEHDASNNMQFDRVVDDEHRSKTSYSPYENSAHVEMPVYSRDHMKVSRPHMRYVLEFSYK